MNSKVKISRILHAGYVFECGQTQIAFDPIFENPFSQNCYAFPNVSFDLAQIKNLKFDATFISHFHDDHCSMESLNLLDRKTPIYVYCIYEELIAMIKSLGFLHVYSLQINVPVKIQTFEIIPRRALDDDVDSIFQIKAGDLNILNVVDSWIDPITMNELSRYAPWDIVLWPFQTMREIEVLSPSRARGAEEGLPVEWTEQLQILNPKYIVPSSCQFIQESWSWYNHALFPISYSKFKQEMKNILPHTKIVRLNPGVSIKLGKNSFDCDTPLEWIKPVGDQNLDYEYKPDLKPPTTAEISKNFKTLNEKQNKRVLEYCRLGIIEKYNSMPSSRDPYFQKSRLWQLSIYDHQGAATHFQYLLSNGKMKKITESLESPAWLTEIPAAKLFSALENGEALTSLYMRINDKKFDAIVEKEIFEVDIINDPLIRCLFNTDFGAYQAAQLRRLSESKN